jgi:hypothetical protein
MQRSFDDVLMPTPRDLQQTLLHRPLGQNARLHCQRVTAEFGTRCLLSANLATEECRHMTLSRPIRDQRELIK